mgnify:CR=1 FL=1
MKKLFFYILSLFLALLFFYLFFFIYFFFTFEKDFKYNFKDIESLNFYKKYSKSINHLRFQPDYKYNLSPEEQLFTKLNNSNQSKKILLQGDSWIEVILKREKAKNYFLDSIKGEAQIINAGISSYSPSLMNVQFDILEKDFNIKPEILLVYIDQTDIGDELCRYRDKISIKNNKIIIPYDKKKYNYFNDYFFIERQKIIRSENLNFFRFIKLINYTFNYNLAKNKKSECSIDNILEPLNKLDIEDANYFIKTLEKFINVSKKNKIEKIILISHPHKNHLNQTYSVNVKNLIDLYLKQIKEDLDINHYYINNFKYSKSISIFRENDQASHLNQAGYENFIDQIIDIINLETK